MNDLPRLEQKPLDRTAVRELTAAIAEQAAAQLEEQAMDEAPWSDEKYKAVLAAQQKENALLAGILAARGITDPADALTLLARGGGTFRPRPADRHGRRLSAHLAGH